MSTTLLKMGFRGELHELAESGLHRSLFTALDKVASAGVEEIRGQLKRNVQRIAGADYIHQRTAQSVLHRPEVLLWRRPGGKERRIVLATSVEHEGARFKTPFYRSTGTGSKNVQSGEFIPFKWVQGKNPKEILQRYPKQKGPGGLWIHKHFAKKQPPVGHPLHKQKLQLEKLDRAGLLEPTHIVDERRFRAAGNIQAALTVNEWLMARGYSRATLTRWTQRDLKGILQFLQKRAHVNSERMKTAEAMYHGSRRRLRKLKTHDSPLTDNPVVFGTPDRELALTFMGKWNDDDFDLGRINDGPLRLKEEYPGALEKVYRGKKGYLYTLDPKGFRKQDNLMRSERVSDSSPRIIKREHIRDLLAELERSGINLVRARDESPHVEKRVRERAPGAIQDVRKIREALKTKKLKRGQTYHAPVEGGYAVIGDVGKRRRHHVVKTVLGPDMKPPGLALYGMTKESVDKAALKEALTAAFTKVPTKEHLKNWPHHAALNAGQAAFYAKEIRKEPELAPDMVEQLVYAVLPPTHHTKKEIENMRREGGLRYWYRKGRR
jgi:hypothetical protein